MTVRLILAFMMLAVVSACSSYNSSTTGVMGQSLPAKPREERKKYGDVESQRKAAPAPVMKQRKVDEVVAAPPAVDSLLNKAASQRRSGNLTAAVATIERAIRIAPRYPGSYYMLGDIRLEQGRSSQARSLAGKSLALGAEGELKQQAENLIALCDQMEP
jgi:tetratricopeptide (TPR) repeat protein